VKIKNVTKFGVGIFVLMWGAVYSIAQTPPSPPTPMAKQTPPARTELSDAEFDARIVATLAKDQAWKQYEFPDLAISVDLPRDPVRQSESFYDEAVGNAKMQMHIAVGDDATYLVGRLPMPYAITEEKLLREAYQEAVKEFAADPEFKFQNPKDFYFSGKLGMELVTVPPKPQFMPGRLRVFFIGRNIYLLVAMPITPEGETSPPSKETKDRMSAEFDRFFASAKERTETRATTAASEAAIFRATFSNRVYRSEYFGFSITMPETWSRVSVEDVEGLRKWGTDYLSENSGKPLPSPKDRRNLASFVSKPLGTEHVAMLAINLGLPDNKPDAPMRMAELTQGLLSKVQTYTLVSGPTKTKLGSTPAVRIEGKMKVLEELQNQVVYFIQLRGYVVAFTLTYYEQADRRQAEAALGTLRFETL
jgi:hypothetical protein